MAPLHSPVKGHINLTLKDARSASSIIDIATDISESPVNLQPLDNAIAAESTGVRGRVPNDTPTKVRLWRRLGINDWPIEQQLFKAYIRCLRFKS